MAKTVEDEHLKKAKDLFEGGTSKHERGREIEEEFEGSKTTAEGCEDIFHSLVEFSESILNRHGMSAENHEERKRKLKDIDKKDLARLYADAKGSLHDACYYKQQTEPDYGDIINDIEEEIEKGP